MTQATRTLNGAAASLKSAAEEDRANRAAAVRIAGLTKRYGGFVAVDDLSLTVEDGDFFGFLGPNGAGKTTTINAIVGLARATSGSIEIFGHDVVSDWRAARMQIGLAPQEYNFDRYLSDSRRSSDLPSRLLRADAARRGRSRLMRLPRALRLEPSKSNEVFTKLSGGMKRRLSLARSLIHSPRLLILDEPTAGVDVELRLELWDLLRELNAAGTTIFLTTHYLEEAETLCRNIGIIEGGRLVALETTPRLLERHGQSALRLKVEGPLEALPRSLAPRTFVETEDDFVRIENVAPGEVAEVLEQLRAAGLHATAIDYGRASLPSKDVFLALTRK